jgi:hypothetical protein
MAVSLSMTEGLSKLLFYDRGSFQAAFLWPGAFISPGVLPSSISIAVSLSMTPRLSTYVRGLSMEPFNSCKPFYNRRSFSIVNRGPFDERRIFNGHESFIFYVCNPEAPRCAKRGGVARLRGGRTARLRSGTPDADGHRQSVV